MSRVTCAYATVHGSFVCIEIRTRLPSEKSPLSSVLVLQRAERGFYDQYLAVSAKRQSWLLLAESRHILIVLVVLPHVMRSDRVSVIFHERQSQNSQPHNSHSPLVCSLHDVHVARGVQNSSNSVGDWVVQGRGVCVPGETKALSTSTRRGVRCSGKRDFGWALG